MCLYVCVVVLLVLFIHRPSKNNYGSKWTHFLIEMNFISLCFRDLLHSKQIIQTMLPIMDLNIYLTHYENVLDVVSNIYATLQYVNTSG